jgi:hypothetical protein
MSAGNVSTTSSTPAGAEPYGPDRSDAPRPEVNVRPGPTPPARRPPREDPIPSPAVRRSNPPPRAAAGTSRLLLRATSSDLCGRSTDGRRHGAPSERRPGRVVHPVSVRERKRVHAAIFCTPARAHAQTDPRTRGRPGKTNATPHFEVRGGGCTGSEGGAGAGGARWCRIGAGAGDFWAPVGRHDRLGRRRVRRQDRLGVRRLHRAWTGRWGRVRPGCGNAHRYSLHRCSC